MKKAEKKLKSSLDLQRFIRRQRSHSLALFGLLNTRQKAFVNFLSQMVMGEESESDHFWQKNSSSNESSEEMDYY